MKSLNKKLVSVVASVVITMGVMAPAAHAQDPTGSTGRCGTLIVLPRVLAQLSMDYMYALFVAFEVLSGHRSFYDKEADLLPEQARNAPRWFRESVTTIPFMDEATRERLYSQYCLLSLYPSSQIRRLV